MVWCDVVVIASRVGACGCRAKELRGRSECGRPYGEDDKAWKVLGCDRKGVLFRCAG
jgi:hypothetical protein